MTTGLPVPKYGVGDTFWIATTDAKTEMFPCPDCRGEKKWKVITPAGNEHTVACPRCSAGGYSSIRQLPPLTYMRYTPRAQLFTVGGMQVRSTTLSDDRDDRISYYSSPNGGAVYHEYQAFDTEEAALASAQIKADIANEKMQSAIEHLEAREFSGLTFQDAALLSHNASLWNAWYTANSLIENLKTWTEGRDGELVDEINSELRYLENYRKTTIPPCPETMYDALRTLVNIVEQQDHIVNPVWLEALAEARAALAEFLKRRPLYHHVKRDTDYHVIGVGEVQSSAPIHEGDELTIYRGVSVSGKLWLRPSTEFNDGRFRRVSDGHEE